MAAVVSRRRLSRQQQSILLHLYHLYQQEDPRERDRYGVFWGVRGTRVRQVSISRTLRRLEGRGLILRLRHAAASAMEGGSGQETSQSARCRTTGVLLLPAGLAVAQRLTPRSSSGC
jgi:hypothetical protein